MLNRPARLVLRFIVAKLMRILRKTIQQIGDLALVPLLERKKKRESLAGKDRLEWRKPSHGAASIDRLIASSSRHPSLS